MDIPRHINVKEITVWLSFLQHFFPYAGHPRSLLRRVDNATDLSYVRNEGGTMVPLLTQIASDIFIWLIVFRFGSFRFSYRRSRIFRQTQRLASGAFPIGICSRKSSAGLW